MMSKRRKSELSTEVIRFDEYMEKGIPDSLLEGLGLDFDEEAGQLSDEKPEENNQNSGDEDSHEISNNLIADSETFVINKETINSEKYLSNLNTSPISTIFTSNTRPCNHPHKPNLTFNKSNSPQFTNKKHGFDSSCNIKNNLIANDPVTEILASQIESIAGNITEAEKQILLRKCLNYANDKSVKLDPTITQRSLLKNPLNVIKNNGTHNLVPNILPASSVIKTTLSYPRSNSIPELNPNNDFPVDENNINEVLENSIKSTQNLRYLLSALKEDLRRVGVTSTSSSLILTKEQLRKKQEVADKLKQAYDVYKRSMRRNIEGTSKKMGEGGKLGKKDALTEEVIELSEESD